MSDPQVKPHVGFIHMPHPHIEARKRQGPVKVVDQHGEGLNGRLAAVGTRLFGSMPTFYLFVIYGALGAIFIQAQATLLYWSNWIQLWSLPLLMVGGIVLGKAADRRADQTFKDAEAVLHECREIQRHLQAQDDALSKLAVAPASTVEAPKDPA